MNIVLIGYRGTGKSEIGSILNKRLGMPCVNMDAEIVKKAGMSIPEIVERYDWPKFRDMETDIATDLARKDNLVIDTGGGIIERPQNIVALKGSGRIFWLKASVDTIVSRIGGDTERPSLTAGKSFTEEVEEVLERRTPLYKEASQYEIDTDELTPGQVADEIIAISSGKSGTGCE